MINQQDIKKILDGYDKSNLTIGTLGGHSALDICRGAKMHGFRTVAVCQKGREKTYEKYYKTRDGKGSENQRFSGLSSQAQKGIIDEIVLVDKFKDIVKKDVQEKLRSLNTIFIHNGYKRKVN